MFRSAFQSAVVLCFAVCGSPAWAARPDILVADFEGKDYGEWKTTGKAFGDGPARGTLAGQMEVTGFQGKGLVNSFLQGDETTGTLTSPPIKIERKYINFLIGGGAHPGETCINLLVDGKTVRTTAGPNDRPGGSEHLEWNAWDVAKLAGKTAVIQIVDRHTGGWGHVNVDHILQSDKRLAAEPADRSREIKIERRYLHLPVKNGAANRRMKLTLDGKTVREFGIELADAKPDYWVFVDVGAFQGKTLVAEVNRLRSGSKGLASIVQQDNVPDAEGLYREKHRPQFHFTSRRGWNNDPNGLVYYKGEYHLYYQHNPYGWKWGNMHWGHAVSTDLAHWKELPIAICPHRFGDWAFSGGAFVDRDNTAGFKTGEEEVIIAAYTSTGRGECLAYSNDRGRTFTDYKNNPVVKHRGRDPKIIWYAPGKHWVMAVYDEANRKRYIAFYTSTNLKDWKLESRIEGYYECPEIFELPVDGDAKNTKWVVYAADGNYAIGTFDGRRFTTETKGKHRGNYGNCFYASQTFSDIPKDDGRRIQIGWGRVATPGMPFNQLMLFPCELTLRKTKNGVRMFTQPVKEIEKLHVKKHTWENASIGKGDLLSNFSGELLDIRASLSVGKTGGTVELNLRGVPVVYDTTKGELHCKGRTAPLAPINGKVDLRILVDRTTIEIFANKGQIYMPIGAVLDPKNRSLALRGTDRTTKFEKLEINKLRSAWE